MTESNHCGLCGDRHHGDCNPESFNYYQCTACKRAHRLPWDAVAFCGFDGMYCGCGKPSGDVWRSVSYDEYLQFQEEDSHAR